MRLNGKKVRLIKIEQRTLVNDETTGEENEVWIDYSTQYAEKLEMQGKEGNQDGQLVAVQDIRWKIRHAEGLNVRDFRIVEGTDVYFIQNIQPLGRNEGAWLMCELRDNEIDDTSVYLVDGNEFITEPETDNYLTNGN